MAVGRGATGGEKTTPSVAKLRQCPYCSYSTTVTTNLKNHLCTHTKEKPYACDRCSYSAITKQTLEDHIRTHTGERPFSCPYCPYNAINKKRLKRHVIKHSVNTLNFWTFFPAHLDEPEHKTGFCGLWDINISQWLSYSSVLCQTGC